MINYVIYETSSGRISSYGVVPDQAHYDIIPCSNLDTITPDSIDDDNKQYYLNGILTTRPAFSDANAWTKTAITANGVDSAIFGPAIPNLTNVRIINQSAKLAIPVEEVIITGTLTITTTAPGRYVVTLTSFPYQPYTHTIIAT